MNLTYEPYEREYLIFIQSYKNSMFYPLKIFERCDRKKQIMIVLNQAF